VCALSDGAVLFTVTLSDLLLPIHPVFRPHCMYPVHKIRPVASDVAHSVVCMSVCWSHGCTVQKRLNQSRCCWGLTLVALRNHVLDGVKVVSL